jgi:hypothetical protein
MQAAYSTGAERQLDHQIDLADYVRRSPEVWGGRRGHKEWLHFVILGDDFDLLVNFSLCDDMRASPDRAGETARVIVLAHDREAWDGDVDTFAAEEVRIRGGGINLSFGDSSLRYRDGLYHLHMRLRERPVAADVTIRPCTFPARAPNVPMPDGPPLHWLIIPRCETSGTLRLGRRTVALDRALTYHDHNWGRLLWGADFSWRWSFAVPRDPAGLWTIAFAALTDRVRARASAQGLVVWRGPDRYRTFSDREMEFESSLEFASPKAVFKIPRVMALLAPGPLTELPRTVVLRAEGEGDWLEYRFEPKSVGQVVIPNDTDLGVSLLNEVAGRSSFRGRIGGEAFDVESRSIFELLGA